MDLLDRLLQHDLWTTQQLLERYRGLTPAQRAQPFDIGHQTLDGTFQHMLARLGIINIIEGDVLSWEYQTRHNPL